MRIFDSLRGHFALLTGHKISTVAGKASFVIERVHSLENPASDWLMEIRIVSSDKNYSVYLSDILNAYTGLINYYWTETGTQWVTLADLQKIVDEVCLDKAKTPYLMALLATFDDIESRNEPKPAIRFIPFRERFK